MQKFSLGTNFRGQASPLKLNPRKFVHTKISNSNYGGRLLPTKMYPLENLTHEILWPQNFLSSKYHIYMYTATTTKVIANNTLSTQHQGYM